MSTPWRRFVLLGLAVATVGAGTLVAGSALSATASARPLTRGAVNVNPGASEPRDFRSQNSPALARNPLRPTRMVVASRIDTPVFSCSLFLTADGGRTTPWTESAIPFPAGEEDPPRCFAPDTTFGADGTLYVSFVTLKGTGNTPNAAWIASSTDSGRTLSTPVRTLGPLAFQVRVTADPVQPGRLYMTWLQADDTANLGFSGDGNPIMFSRSDDGGATWADPVTVSQPERRRLVAPSVAVGPGGEVYVLYLDLGADVLDYNGAHQGRGGEPYGDNWSLVMSHSLAGGSEWQHTVVDAEVVPAERFVSLVPPSPSMAVDPTTGRVYVGFQDSRLGDADVWLWSSPAGGGRFSQARRVNDTGDRDRTAQYRPVMAVAPDGRLDVVYYDRRDDPADVKAQVSLQSSNDGGLTFTSRTRISDRAFDSGVGSGSERGLPDIGSRLGLVSSEDGAVAVWTDTRAGTRASNKQDLARAVVTFSDASSLRRPLQIGGVVLEVLGISLAVAGIATARRRSPARPKGAARDPA